MDAERSPFTSIIHKEVTVVEHVLAERAENTNRHLMRRSLRLGSIKFTRAAETVLHSLQLAGGERQDARMPLLGDIHKVTCAARLFARCPAEKSQQQQATLQSIDSEKFICMCL